MAHEEDDLRARLRRAALEMFQEHGYDRTTAAGIARRAGVTERTFFRQFPDKREVLFDGEAVLRAALTVAISEVPVQLGPLDALFHAFRSVVPLLEGNRPYAKPRQDIIAVTPALQERELAKTAALAGALADMLAARGVAASSARLAAHAAMAAFVQAILAWLADPDPDLTDRLDTAERELRALLA